jgi:hypothetical protein
MEAFSNSTTSLFIQENLLTCFWPPSVSILFRLNKGDSMIHQRNPTILVNTLLGRGHALFLIEHYQPASKCLLVGSAFQ